MADAILSVELTAKIDSFRDSFNAAIRETNNLDKATKARLSEIDKNFEKLANDVDSSMGKAVKATSNASNSISQSLAKTAAASVKAGGSVALGANQAGNALTNLGRVAQDAPFGFIGIQNNLNPLLESFQRLRAETGSNGAALKALGSSLIGPAGLGLALSLASSALLLYQEYQRKAKDSTDQLSSSSELLKKALQGDEYVKAVSNINELRINVDLAKQGFISKDGVIKQYNETLGKTAGVVKTLDEVESSLVKNGNAYIQMTLYKATAQLALKEAAEQAYKAEQIRERGRQTLASPNLQDKSGFENLTFFERLKDAFAQDDSKTKVLIKKSTDNLAKDADDRTNGILKIANNFQTKAAEIAKKFGFNFFDDNKIQKDAKNGLGKANTTKLGNLPEILGLGDLSKPFTIQPKFEIKPLVTGISELTKFSDAAQAQIDKILSFPSLLNRGAEVFASAFEAMGASIANGGDILSAAGGILQQAFADLLGQLGQQFITKGAALIAAGIIESSNPLTALAGAANISTGTGLVALGAGLAVGGGIVGAAGKGKKRGGVTAFADGGIISGPTLGLMGEYAGAKSDPEVVAPLSKLKRMLGQQDAAGNAIVSSNAQQPIMFEHRVEIDGNKLVVLTDRIKAQQNRIS